MIVRELLAGAGLGALVGLLVGLSVQEVAGGLIAALTALLATFFGLRKPANDSAGGSPSPAGGAWRIGAFGLVGALALLAGINLRTHNALGPSVADQVNNYLAAGYEQAEALQFVAFERLGITQSDWRLVNEDSVGARRGSGVLFGTDVDDTECRDLEERYFTDTAEWLNAFRAAAEPWPTDAARITNLPVDAQRGALQAIWRQRCAGGSQR